MKVEVDADELADLRSELKRLRERENELLACNSRLVLERQKLDEARSARVLAEIRKLLAEVV